MIFDTQKRKIQSSLIDCTVSLIISNVLFLIVIMEFKLALLMVILSIILSYHAICIDGNDRYAQGKIDLCVNCRYICIMTTFKITTDYVIDTTHSQNTNVNKNIKIDAFYINYMLIQFIFIELGLILRSIVTILMGLLCILLKYRNHSSVVLSMMIV